MLGSSFLQHHPGNGDFVHADGSYRPEDVCAAVLTGRPEQLSLLGHPTPIRLPAELWLYWLTDKAVVARFEAKHYIRSPTRCWPWLGAVSSTGHGSFRAASLPGPSRRGTVPAHLGIRGREFPWSMAQHFRGDKAPQPGEPFLLWKADYKARRQVLVVRGGGHLYQAL
ncbi:hypothetical protein ACWCQN_41775 [Streptomyces sp. NPDC001984]|uniref:hypothetical protein n=1 Tax=Streptomyces sp. NPDC002619 TaxID=3364655 RepID=UPI003682386D